MEPVTSESLMEFLARLGKNAPDGTNFYLLGGSALSILGNPRKTLDIDYLAELSLENQPAFEKLVEQIANQLDLDVEEVSIAEFVPLPPNALARRRFIARFGNLDVFVYDLYTIALSKLARGFESDLEDLLFMLQSGLIDLSELDRFFQAVLPDVAKVDIDRREFNLYFNEVKKRFQK
jgi:hypothetical protein